MVKRIYVEKKPSFANESSYLLSELRDLLGIKQLTALRIVNRYDVEGLEDELFAMAVRTVFSEPQVDDTYAAIKADEGDTVFAAEYLPGQFDMRASSAEECIQLISKGERPFVRTAVIYILSGALTAQDIEQIKKYVINPVEAREASLELPGTLKVSYDIPEEVETLDGFNLMTEDEMPEFLVKNGLAMDIADLRMCRDYFKGLRRDPTITEIKVIDTYWSDHCRHTTFNTIIDKIKFEDPNVAAAYEEYLKMRDKLCRKKPVTLMDICTINAADLKSEGLLDNLDESEEINACTVKIKVDIDGKDEDWLILFKNETHNHPTEIEPFGGAATCIGGAIRDPLSGRSYVYSAMRVTGAADPLKPVSETINGKLPQRKIVTTAAAGYSSYGNQIGLATGQVDEIYHPGYIAKRMEIGAVIAAAPQANVRREHPIPGDVVILLGGKTGRDGCGGATGSSKSHTTESLETCGAEVQKGNAPEERKLQRLFRNSEAARLIKRCNDFGAGGVSVAIGELADGLEVNLNKIPKKYEGLDGTELSISESQERMAVVVAAEDSDRFCELARQENLESTAVAEVTEEPYLRLNWNGKTIVDISRQFLDTNGAEKHIEIHVPEGHDYTKSITGTFREKYLAVASDLNSCSKRGLSERFDSTIGAGTVLMPFGGLRQRTPTLAMVNLIPSEKGDTNTCSVMAWDYDPYITSADPYKGAYLAVLGSVAKLIATGAECRDIYLTFQEYFKKPGHDGTRWAEPLAAVLGAFSAQRDLGIAAIGGKDSMSGSFEDIDVPPTLVSFAVTTCKADRILSSEFKGPGHDVILLEPEVTEQGLPDTDSFKKNVGIVSGLVTAGEALSIFTPRHAGIAEAVMKMCMGNALGFEYDENMTDAKIFGLSHGSFIVELKKDAKDILMDDYRLLGRTSANRKISLGRAAVTMYEINDAYESKLEPIYPCNIKPADIDTTPFTYPETKPLCATYIKKTPKTLIPVFPGTNCEYDSAKAFRDAGAEPEIFVINNLSPEAIALSVEKFAAKIRDSEMIFIPGGFSGGDEPDGSGKFITAFFRNPEITEAVNELIDVREGLMAGICNGFQALIKLGLVPFGRISDTDETYPTLTYNAIGRHQSKLIRTRVCSNKSPWMSETKPGDIYTIPISHGEGRFVASEELIAKLAENGQIITQYVDLRGRPTGDIQFNPNGSYSAVEGITSPDGRILGKMGHSERIGKNLYKNVPGNFDMGMFRSAVNYFR